MPIGCAATRDMPGRASICGASSRVDCLLGHRATKCQINNSLASSFLEAQNKPRN